MTYKKIVMLMFLCLLVTLAGCGRHKKAENATESTGSSSAESSTEKFDEITLDGMAGDVISQMTLEEKVGQLFIVCTDSLDFYAENAVTDTMKEQLQKYQPGGIIFFSFNLKDREQISHFIQDMNEQVKIPMFMSVDEEGGVVARIANHPKMKTTVFPSMQEIGASGNLSEAGRVGATIGKEIKELGFNLDFAPVADVISNEANQEIGERSFGDDPELVSNMIHEVVMGLQNENVSATLKHFPGQGSSENDTHKGFVDLPTNIDDLRKVEFLPFKKGIKDKVDFIMMSHVAASNVTGDDLPASLSRIMVSDILRDELKYDGIIITDAMNMKSITKFFESDEAAVKAFKAGNDMILMPDDFEAAVDGMLNAVKTGKISEEAIDDALMRIMRVKIKRGIIPPDFPSFS